MIPENDTVKAERFSLFGLLLQKDFLLTQSLAYRPGIKLELPFSLSP